VSEWQIFKLIREGELASFKPGRLRLIPLAAVNEYANRLIEEAA
jgi:excisionase family DNA binding protein